MTRSYLSTTLIIALLLFSHCESETAREVKSTGKNYGIASASRLATDAGLKILENGGNAFDAAITVASVLNVSEPMMSGLGGYGTILVYSAKENKVWFLNCSGRFPLLSNSDLMRAPTPDFEENRRGPKSISTPGNLNAWASMHEKYGSYEWSDLFNAAIKHSKEGIRVNEGMEMFLGWRYEDFSENAKEIFGKDGESLAEGDLLVQEELSVTFESIASQGAEDFYNGDWADKIDSSMKIHDSFLRKEDLIANEAEWWEPMRFDYNGYEVYIPSLPANSFPTLVNLGLMQALTELDKADELAYHHAFAEMTKESYKARLAFSFDPEVKEAPLDSLLSKEVLSEWAAGLRLDSASQFVLPFKEDSKNTTHFTVVDKEGNIVSATQTLGNLFGSGIMAEGTGVFLNNSMAYATYEPKGNPMDVFPGRRKLSGDSPVIIMKDGKPYAALGTPGGHTITQNVPQIIFNLIDFKMGMQESIDAPKLSFVEPDLIIADEHMDEGIIEGLKSLGHNVRTSRIGNAHGILIFLDENGNVDSLEVGEDFRGASLRD